MKSLGLVKTIIYLSQKLSISYQSIYINPEKLEFIHRNYVEQIKALELFFKDAFPSTIDKNVIKFGG